MSRWITTLAVVLGALALPAAAPAELVTFTNNNDIVIDGDGPADTYPSIMDAVSGIPGPITDVDVQLDNVDHTIPDDLDILLSSPMGDSVELMSDVCGAADAVNADWRFDDEAASHMADSAPCPSGFYKPTQQDAASDVWPVEFPSPHKIALLGFDGENPNATSTRGWQLHVRDDAADEAGLIDSWTLRLDYEPAKVELPAGAQTAGPAGPYPVTFAAAPNALVITDLNVELGGFYHSHPDDVDILLEAPGGQRVMLMSDACGDFGAGDVDLKFDDEAPSPMPDAGPGEVCPAGTYKPTDHGGSPDVLPAPAPAGAYATSLDAFDFLRTEGIWRFWINDDSDGNEGFLMEKPKITMTTRLTAYTAFSAASFETTEGQTAEATIERIGASEFGAGDVRVRSSGDTAETGLDFAEVDEVVHFAPGQATATVAIPITAGGGAEPAEAFTLELSEAGGDVRLSPPPAPATVTIAANGADPEEPAGGSSDGPAGGAVPGGPAGSDPLGTPVLPPAFTALNAATLTSARKCLRRRARVRLRPRAPKEVELVRTVVEVNGRKLADRRGAQADDVVRLRIRGRRTRVVLTLTAADGRSVIVRRTYRRCR